MHIIKNCDTGLLFLIAICITEASARSKSPQNQGCAIKLPNDIPKTEPLYLSGNPARYRLFKPINESNVLAVNSKLTLFCPGKRNSLTNRQQNMTELQCNTGNRFLTENGEEIQIHLMNCTKGIDSSLQSTREKCSSNRGFIFDVGFRVNRRNFLNVFKICYNNSTETTFFSMHLVNGPVVKYFVKDNKRRNFKTTGFPTNTKVNMIYNKRNQIARFNQILGSQQNFVNNSNFLSRGHLTPDADFVFPNFQLATYFYANVAPEFQSINSGNWLRIENMARELASAYNTEFVIYTEVHEILSLPNQYGNPVELFLDDANKIAVPKWFWKAIKNLKLDAAIVMITLNNPFAKRSEILEFCPNICKEASLTSEHFENFKKGYTFCCEVDEFKNVVNDLPRNFTASRLLECAHANYLFNKQT